MYRRAPMRTACGAVAPAWTATLGASRAWATPTSTSSGSASAATCSAGRSTSSARSRCSTRTCAAGGNFIDTADSYGRRGPGGAGESERIIGRWIAARGNRDQLVIATKVGMSPELPGLSAANDPHGRRGLAGAAGHRSHRPLLRAQGRPRDAARGDARGVRRADRRRHDPLRGGVQLQRRSACEQALRIGERDGMAVLRRATAALQPDGARAATRASWRRCASAHGSARAFPTSALARGFLTRQVPPRTASRSTARARRACARATSTSAASPCSTRSMQIAAAHERRGRGGRARVAARAADGARADRERDLAASRSAELVASVELELSAAELSAQRRLSLSAARGARRQLGSGLAVPC